jgi:hypothetical protein
MRPPAVRQSHFFCPFDAVLGTKGAVRILRELARAQESLTTRALADRAHLTSEAVRKTLRHELVPTGVVTTISHGRVVSHSLNQRHPLCASLSNLFGAEMHRAQTVFDALREAVGAGSLFPPIAVWLVGGIAAQTDTAPTVLEVVVVSETESSEAQPIRQDVERLLHTVAEAQQLTINCKFMTLSELLRAKSGELQSLTPDAISLVGPTPNELRGAELNRRIPRKKSAANKRRSRLAAAVRRPSTSKADV